MNNATVLSNRAGFEEPGNTCVAFSGMGEIVHNCVPVIKVKLPVYTFAGV